MQTAMNKPIIKDLNTNPFLYESIFQQNSQQNIFFNISSIPDEWDEYNNENSNEDKYYTEKIEEDFIKEKIIDLSFLDTDTDDPEESDKSKNGKFENNISIIDNTFNYKIQDENGCNKNISENNSLIYEMMLANNFYKNFYYHQPTTYMNNLIRMDLQMNNQKSINHKQKYKTNLDKKYLINIIDLKTNKEKRTTIRMMNIPSYYKPLDLAKKIDDKFCISPQKENRVYDFIYIPFKKGPNKEDYINVGFAFINFVHPGHIIKFYSIFHGKRLKSKMSGKVCVISFASRQGVNLQYYNSNLETNDKFMYFTDTKNHLQLLND